MQKLVGEAIPAEMTVGGVTYEILSFHEEGENSVGGGVMVERSKTLNAHQGKKEREHLLANQADIPVACRGRTAFVFTDERHPDVPDEGVYYVCWRDGRWVEGWDWLDEDWGRGDRVLRRK